MDDDVQRLQRRMQPGRQPHAVAEQQDVVAPAALELADRLDEGQQQRRLHPQLAGGEVGVGARLLGARAVAEPGHEGGAAHAA